MSLDRQTRSAFFYAKSWELFFLGTALMPDMDFTGIFAAAAFFAVLAIAACVAVAVSWLGYHNAALWTVGAGVVGGYLAAKLMRSVC
jgi:hypothetical protein